MEVSAMDERKKLTQMTVASGCAAKLGPGALDQILSGLPNRQEPELLVGFGSSDDACVYRVSDQLAIVETVDFFTPIVDDPYMFGQIAAANAISDVYAMGGVPRLAMNLLCVPGCLPKEDIRAILEGGHDKAVEAGCVVAGGHTIQDNEPKYGMCVTGFIHPDRILRNVGARPGDLLILTKALGCGVLTTGAKADMVEAADYETMMRQMATLNDRTGRLIAAAPEVHACTDVTGFGLLGHCYEMSGGQVTLVLDSAALPLLPGARDLAGIGIIPAGAYRNFDHVKPELLVRENVPRVLADLAADPQTSGGLLAALPEKQALELLPRLQEVAPVSAVIGRVEEKGAARIILE